MCFFKKEKVKKALEKSKKLNKKKDKYTMNKLQKEDNWFKKQSKNLFNQLSALPKFKKTKKK